MTCFDEVVFWGGEHFRVKNRSFRNVFKMVMDQRKSLGDLNIEPLGSSITQYRPPGPTACPFQRFGPFWGQGIEFFKLSRKWWVWATGLADHARHHQASQKTWSGPRNSPGFPKSFFRRFTAIFLSIFCKICPKGSELHFFV